jgi:Fic family protein
MEKLLQNLTLDTMQAVLKKISAIENYNGSWLNIETTLGGPLIELRELATLQSTGSSTRIEGSKLNDAEIDSFIKNIKKTSFTTRDEEEVAGYYTTLDTIFDSYEYIDITENSIKHLHKSLLQHTSKDKHHLGEYKKLTNSVVATYADGTQITVFNTTPPMQTPMAMQDTVQWLQTSYTAQKIHPLIIIAAFVYEFLSIHPFQDGNGRLSRLLTTLLLLQKNYLYIQYVSFEHHIEKRKKQYYAALRNGQSLRNTPEENCNEWLLFFLDCMEQMTITLDKKYNQLIKRGNYVSKRQVNIIQLIERKGQVKLADLVDAFKGSSNATLKKDLQLLVQLHKIEKTGKLKGTIYTLPDE